MTSVPSTSFSPKTKKPSKPWCWYCNREFAYEEILIQHQRFKHFKCPLCALKVNSACGLAVHYVHVHNAILEKVPNALPNRSKIDIEIYGMKGIPTEDLKEHESQKQGSSREFLVPSGPYLENLSLDFSKLLESQILPDVKLKCAERTFSAHRAVLAARSQVFAAMFRNGMVECKKGVVDIPDFEAPVLDLFLKFVYTGKIQGLSEDLVPGVYAASDKYAVHELKKACSDRMIEGLTEGNCVSLLTVADAHSDAPFKHQVVSFICGREAILLSEVWLSFRNNHKELANEVYDSYFRSKSRTSVYSSTALSTTSSTTLSTARSAAKYFAQYYAQYC